MGQIKDFFTFNKLLTPSLIKYLYWIAAGGILLMSGLGIVMSIIGLVNNFIASLISIIATLIFTPISLLWLRVFCEKILVTFLIEARLRELNHRIGGGR